MEAEDLAEETAVPPERPKVQDQGETQRLLDEIRAFVDRAGTIVRHSSSIDPYTLEQGLTKLRELDQRVTSLERAADLARAYLDIARQQLSAQSEKLKA